MSDEWKPISEWTGDRDQPDGVVSLFYFEYDEDCDHASYALTGWESARCLRTPYHVRAEPTHFKFIKLPKT